MDKGFEDFLWFMAVIVILFILWAAAGGKDRTVDRVLNVRSGTSSGQLRSLEAPRIQMGSRYIENPSGAGSNSGSDSYTSNFSSASSDAVGNKSQYFGKVALRSGSASATNPSSEYLIIEASKSIAQGIPITNWALVSTSTGRRATIGQGVVLPFLNDTSAKENIVMVAGDKATVITGVSPTGYSFRLNKCIGYFSERYNFSPQLPYSCPHISDLPLPQPPNNLSDACIDYINSFPSCSSIQKYPPSNVDSACRSFIEGEARYDRCVYNNKKDTSFYNLEWRVYLGQSSELWKGSRETVQLLDQYGKIVDQLTF